MNIITFYIILLLFIISNVNSINILSLLKRDDLISSEYKTNKECINERENSEYINKCMPFSLINLSNYKENCLNIKSEKCQNFYKESNPLQYFPICSQFDEFKEIFDPAIFQSSMNNIQAYCQTDENDELCPLSLFKLTLTDKTFSSSTLLNDTCQSKKCTDSYIEFLSKKSLDDYAAIENSKYFDKKYSYDDIVAAKKVISELESDKCKAMHVTSNAITIKTNYILLMSIFLLLLFGY